MDNNVQRKARLILAGLAALPAISLASGTHPVQTFGYGSPYSEGEEIPSDLTQVTGLNQQELQEAKQLVAQLNQLDVIAVKEMNLTQAPVNSYHYHSPIPRDVAAARVKNLDRLAKLRLIVEAAK